jgi:hypothetical protein
MNSAFIYKARTREQWECRAEQSSFNPITPEQRRAIAGIVDLEWLDFLDGWWTKGEEVHWFDCWDCGDPCGMRLRDFDETELKPAFDAEYKRAGAYHDPEFWSRFVRWCELNSLDSLTPEQEAELRLIEVEPCAGRRTTVTDQQKLAAVEISLDRTLTLETVKLALGIEHSDSDDLLRILIASCNLGCRSGWSL